MVPGSTFRYGSNFIRLTFNPRLSSRQPIEAAANPLPKLDTTPPVTKMYLEDIPASPSLIVFDWRTWRARSIISAFLDKRKNGNRSKGERVDLVTVSHAHRVRLRRRLVEVGSGAPVLETPLQE